MNDSSPEPAELLSPQVVTFDAIMPAAMAVRAEETGVQKASNDPVDLPGAERLGGRLHFFRRRVCDDCQCRPHCHYAGRRRDVLRSIAYGVVRLLTGLAFSSA